MRARTGGMRVSAIWFQPHQPARPAGARATQGSLWEHRQGFMVLGRTCWHQLGSGGTSAPGADSPAAPPTGTGASRGASRPAPAWRRCTAHALSPARWPAGTRGAEAGASAGQARGGTQRARATSGGPGQQRHVGTMFWCCSRVLVTERAGLSRRWSLRHAQMPPPPSGAALGTGFGVRSRNPLLVRR